MIDPKPEAIEEKLSYRGIEIFLERYAAYYTLGLNYFEVDRSGRGTPEAQEVYIWCEAHGFDMRPTQRFDSFCVITPEQAMMFKIRWF